MLLRLDLLTDRSPHGLAVYQLTTDPDLPSCHLYMEAQIFTPDSRRFVLHRSAHAHGSDSHDPRHRYQLCDLDNNCALTDLTDEVGATAPSVSPDGTAMYYFVNKTEPGGGRLALKRVTLDGTQRETLIVVDNVLPGTHFCPSRPYPLSTISADGKRLAISAFLGDGKTADAPWGLLVFDLERADVQLIIHGTSWCNMHPQYSRAREAAHDLLIQENHGCVYDALGTITKLTGGDGADIHLIRDDGSNFRDLPWGRDGNEYCQGHQCWRGRSAWAITSTHQRDTGECRLITGLPASASGHRGSATPDGIRNDLSRDFPNPCFSHFAKDIAGTRLVTDAMHGDPGGEIYLAALPTTGDAPATDFTYLLSAHCSLQKDTHLHPFLAPDGRTAFFNSDESGTLQAYMICGLPAVIGQ